MNSHQYRELSHLLLQASQAIRQMADYLVNRIEIDQLDIPSLPIYGRPLENAVLSVRARKACRNSGVATLGQLASLEADDVINWKNCGITTLSELRDYLAANGLKFRDDP